VNHWWQWSQDSGSGTFKYLEESDMEHIMGACLCWKMEAVSEPPHTLYHLEWTIEARCKLGTALSLMATAER
jgi:hypothetical protein